MKAQLLIPRPGKALKGLLPSFIMTLALVAGLFMVSVWLPPLGAPVHSLNAPAVVAASPAAVSKGVSGTLASFTALFPGLGSIYLPVIVH